MKNNEIKTKNQKEEKTIIPKSNEEILKEIKAINVIHTFEHQMLGKGVYFICLNGISNNDYDWISISELSELITDEIIDISNSLDKLFEDDEIDIIKYIIENRLDDLVEMEINYCINSISNRISDEIEDMGGVEKILKENKKEIIKKIKGNEIKAIVEQEFNYIIKAISVQIETKPIILAKINKIIQVDNLCKINVTTIPLDSGDYKLGKYKIKESEASKFNLKDLNCANSYISSRYDVIHYLIKNIIPEYVTVDMSIWECVEHCIEDIWNDLEWLADKVKNKNIWDIGNFKLDIFG